MIKAKIYKTQQNSKCHFCDDRDEKINHIIGDCKILFTLAHIAIFFFILPFRLLVLISYSSLDLVYSSGHWIFNFLHIS